MPMIRIDKGVASEIAKLINEALKDRDVTVGEFTFAYAMILVAITRNWEDEAFADFTQSLPELTRMVRVMHKEAFGLGLGDMEPEGRA